MKIYRGPASLSFDSDAHEWVANVAPEKLEEALKNDRTFSFNINKDASERQSICTVQFEDNDLIPILNGIAVRLQRQQSVLSEIAKITQDREVTDVQKIGKIINMIKRV